MKSHRVAVLLASLALGAIINIVVAWSCALGVTPEASGTGYLRSLDAPTWAGSISRKTGACRVISHLTAPKPLRVGIQTDDPDIAREYRERVEPRVAALRERHLAMPVPGWCRASRPPHSADYNLSFIDEARGWPLLSLRCSYRFLGRRMRTRGPVSGGVPLANRPTPHVHRQHRALPLVPIGLGFCVNTLFFAAFAWPVIRTLLMVRSRTRKRRGRCPTCGYPRGQSSICSECGNPHSLQPVA